MGWFNRKDPRPMTAVEALNNELRRLDQQMSEFTFPDGFAFNQHHHDTMMGAYTKLSEQRSEIAKSLVEIAKLEVAQKVSSGQ